MTTFGSSDPWIEMSRARICRDVVRDDRTEIQSQRQEADKLFVNFILRTRSTSVNETHLSAHLLQIVIERR